MTVFYDTASNFHPYECDGPGKCLHCDRLQRTSLMTGDVLHDPATCALCDPVYDGSPNQYRGRFTPAEYRHVFQLPRTRVRGVDGEYEDV